MIDSFSRIYSQVYKSIVGLRRNTFRLADVFIWPMIFLFTLTFFVTYLGSDAVYLNVIILGMMGWRMIYFLNLEMVSSFTEEHWSKSLPHLMISPITRLEFAIGAAISGLLKALFVILIYIIFTGYLYGFVITDWPIFLLALGFFALIGFSMGLFTLGLGYFMKEEAFNIAFIWPDVIVLLSGVYFSIDKVYPESILPFIKLLPSTHAFELMKSMQGIGHPDIPLMAALTAAWLIAAYLFNGYMYEKARRAGKLARLG
ncbi:MAG TPA: ABC transporter permease [Candidatus Bilamarchaeum sp.]|nr:ABC transporter permease [Candidatus Bilamarchaeum sp.]